ncbi:reverse transcriptase family protein [Shewanella sp. TB4-MNA-CIBAN-0142]|uniref:reverse transcriptase family protein n=1 Tax=Shewanella sp. TB4-MNA-CIBAN-0142 TaxID=3140464 RepID=UPI00331F0A77
MAFQYNYGKRSSNSISNIENLLKALDISLEQYSEALDIPKQNRYVKSSTPKSDGTERVVHNPHKHIRRIQRRINKRIFNQRHRKGGLISWPSYLYGSIPNNPQTSEDIEKKDYIACAQRHCESRSILKMDIQNFFDNIQEEHVYSVFKGLLHFPDVVSKALTSICCHEGSVIQGALTSSYIASAVLYDIEPLVVKRLHDKKLRYTRLVDDITISSEISNYDFAYAQKIVIDMLYKKGLPTNNSKTEILHSSSSELLVHGLRVNFKTPRLPAKEVGKIRASVKHLETFAKDSVFRTSRDYRVLFNKSLGRVNRLKRLGHIQHAPLLGRLLRIEPKPNKSDIGKAKRLVSKIIALNPKYGSGYRYRQLYYKAQSDLNVLQRTFKRTALKLRGRLREVKPSYEN